jgi:DnaJ-class molecular chaperone
MSALSLYEILGVSRSATPDAIRAAYRRKLLQLHPDKSSQHSSTRAESNVVAVHELQHAYDVLRDVARRKEYDAQLDAACQQQECATIPWLSISIEEMEVFTTEHGSEAYEFECRCGDVFELSAQELPKEHNTSVTVPCRSCTNILLVRYS